MSYCNDAIPRNVNGGKQSSVSGSLLWICRQSVLTPLANVRRNTIPVLMTVAFISVSTTAIADEIKVFSATPPPTPKRDGDDWPWFLGPDHTGVSQESGILEEWPEDGPPVVWKKQGRGQIGSGYSAPSVRGNRLVLHHRVGSNEVVECMRADTGDPLWQYSYPSNFSDPYGYNNGPRCSPLLTEERCYTLGAEGMLLCVDLQNAKKIWSRPLKEEFDIPKWFFGVGCTPILEDGRLYVLVGGRPNSGVVAFDADTGETLWENVGRDTWDGAETDWPREKVYKWTDERMLVSYSSPILATFHGKRHLLCLMRQGLVSLDPETGKLNFKYWFQSNDYESVNAARPVVIGDQILLSAAYEVGAALLKVNEDGASFDVVWRDRRNLATHWSTPIVDDGFAYGFSGRHENEGSFRCIDLATGKVIWKTSGFEGGLDSLTQNPATGEIIDRATGKPVPWPYFGRGSKIKVGNKFIVLGERGGTMALVRIDSGSYSEISRTAFPELQYPSWTAPVLSRKRLYLRTEKALLCLDLAN